MSLWLAKVSKGDKVGLIPTSDRAHMAIDRLDDGEIVKVNIIRPRSAKWNRMYFGICDSIGENQDPKRSEDSIDSELRIRAGHYEVLLINGEEWKIPKRIAFDKLTADEWEELWKSLEIAIRETFGEEYIWEHGP